MIINKKFKKLWKNLNRQFGHVWMRSGWILWPVKQGWRGLNGRVSRKMAESLICCLLLFLFASFVLVLNPLPQQWQFKLRFNKIQTSVQHKRQTCLPVHPDRRGAMAEWKVTLRSEATLQQLSQDWLSVMWTSSFPDLFATIDLVFGKSCVLLFSCYWDTMFY